jgi:DNA-binding response OmpR family regulator
MARPLDVLVVEDDASLRDVIALHLNAEGWSVRAVGDGADALAACASRQPDVLVLDVMLPGKSGIDVCAALRALYNPSPGVVMLTARDREVDVILGYEVGADDYVVKPCRPREIVARVRAVARRVNAAPRASKPADETIVRGPLHVDLATRKVTVRGAAVKLTPTELELLAFLARHPDRVYTRSDLLEAVFDTSHEGYARNVDCHVTRVRRKLEAAGLDPAPIDTVHGTGYRFLVPAA